jgi:hypothetical protein
MQPPPPRAPSFARVPEFPMQFSARFFNWGSPGEGMLTHAHTWTFRTADDASGRELVRIAMRRAGWPEGRYRAKFSRHHDGIMVEIDVEERPRQLITLMICDPSGRYSGTSFTYIEPIRPMSTASAKSRLASIGLFAVCLLGMVVIIPMHLFWALFKPERAIGIAAQIDRAANGALRGNPRETISSRANRARVHRKRWGCLLCNLLDWFKEGHCEDSAGK